MTDWEPIERMCSDEREDWRVVLEEYLSSYAENPPHGSKGHRVSRNCDQCVENAT